MNNKKNNYNISSQHFKHRNDTYFLCFKVHLWWKSHFF